MIPPADIIKSLPVFPMYSNCFFSLRLVMQACNSTICKGSHYNFPHRFETYHNFNQVTSLLYHIEFEQALCNPDIDLFYRAEQQRKTVFIYHIDVVAILTRYCQIIPRFS